MEKLDVLVSKVATEDNKEEVDEVNEYTAKEIAEEASENIKTELISQMSPVNLKIQSGRHSQMIEGRGSLRTICAQSYWQIKNRRTTISVSAEKYNKNPLISHIIAGVQNASRNIPGFSGGVNRFPTNRNKAHISDKNIFSTSSKRNDTE